MDVVLEAVEKRIPRPRLARNVHFVEGPPWRVSSLTWAVAPSGCGGFFFVSTQIAVATAPDSMHQHPDYDSDHAQRSHDGEGDKATLEKIHLIRPVRRAGTS
jgi:hypothetical protein